MSRIPSESERPSYGKGSSNLIQLLFALILAFLLGWGIGKFLVPWLKKNNITQPLKKDVAEKVYSDENGSAAGQGQNSQSE